MTSVPQTKPPEGFVPWLPFLWVAGHDTPYRYDTAEAWRYGRQDTELLRPNQLPEWFNVAGLYWRPIRKGDETVN